MTASAQKPSCYC